VLIETSHLDQSFATDRTAAFAKAVAYMNLRKDDDGTAAGPAIDITPARAVTRRFVPLQGITVEFVQAVRRERMTTRYRGPRHLLIVHEQGVRTEGETVLEGAPRSSLRDMRQKLTFVPAGSTYQDWQEPKVLSRAVHVYFDPSDMPLVPSRNGGAAVLLPRLFFSNATLWEAAVKLASICEADDPASRSYREALGIVLAHEIARLNAGPEADKAPARGGLAGWQKRVVTTYVDEHLGENIPLAKLAGLARLSPHYFCRAFKQSFGVPPHRYHTGRRIERAKAMLSEPANSVTEIGLTLGFSETSSFTAAFRRTTGQSPTAYRRDFA